MSQTNEFDASPKTNSHVGKAPVISLTLAQAKAGLLLAAREGLIDGSELNESWFQTLRRDIYAAAKKSKTAVKDTKSKKEKAKADPPKKKVSAAVSGFIKFSKTAVHVEVPAKINTVDEVKEFCLIEHNAKIYHAFVQKHDYIGETGKAINTDTYAQALTDTGLDESEVKASRTWFPAFFAKKSGKE